MSCREKSKLPGEARSETAVFVLDPDRVFERLAGGDRTERRIHPGIIRGRLFFRTIVSRAFPVQRTIADLSKHPPEVEISVVPYLLQKIGASDGCLERWQTQLSEHGLQVGRDVQEKTNNVFRLATEPGPQFRLLCRDAGRASVEMALACHVASQCHQYGGAEGKFVGAKQGGDQNVSRRREAAIDTQPHTPAKTVVTQNLLRLAQAHLPGIAGMLDAA
jgi:hypothetical protein